MLIVLCHLSRLKLTLEYFNTFKSRGVNTFNGNNCFFFFDNLYIKNGLPANFGHNSCTR